MLMKQYIIIHPMFSLKQDILCIVSVQKNLHVSFAQMISPERPMGCAWAHVACGISWGSISLHVNVRGGRPKNGRTGRGKPWKTTRYRCFTIWDLTLVLVISCYIMLYPI